MPTVRVSSGTTALACAGFLTAALSAVTLDYARFHGLAADWRYLVDILCFVSLIGGGVAYLQVTQQHARWRAERDGPGPDWRAGTVALTIAVAIGIAFAFGRFGATGQMRMWLDMAFHAMLALPAFSAVMLWRESARAVPA